MFYRLLSFYILLFLVGIPLMAYHILLSVVLVAGLVALSQVRLGKDTFSFFGKVIIVLYGVVVLFVSYFYKIDGCGREEIFCFDGWFEIFLLYIIAYIALTVSEERIRRKYM